MLPGRPMLQAGAFRHVFIMPAWQTSLPRCNPFRAELASIQRHVAVGKYSCCLQVALANDGRVFVADGYCNSRVLEYSAQGEWRGEYVLPEATGHSLQNPHSIVLQECAQALYVAEREASRVLRFSMGTRELEGMSFCHYTVTGNYVF